MFYYRFSGQNGWKTNYTVVFFIRAEYYGESDSRFLEQTRLYSPENFQKVKIEKNILERTTVELRLTSDTNHIM